MRCWLDLIVAIDETMNEGACTVGSSGEGEVLMFGSGFVTCYDAL
jgi:hypothetical protein